jgi:hypothetical protein
MKKFITQFRTLVLTITVLLFAVSTSAQTNTCTTTAGVTISGHSVLFLGATYSGSGATATTTFRYTVTSSFAPNISHFTFGNATCVSCFDDASDFQSTSGGNVVFGEDPTVKLCGIKYDFSIQGGQSATVSFTLKGFYSVGLITFGVKAGQNEEYAPICGPVCRSPQQISGNVFNDADGLTDNNINQSAGVANPKTNAGGLFANLLNTAGVVVATTPVSLSGVYVFENVAVGTYTVQISTISGTVGNAAPAQQLPLGWVSTGEFGSTLPGNGAGNDGVVNGRSAQIVVAPLDNKTEVNFGIERLPESKNFTESVANPAAGTVYVLNSTPVFNLPILIGSDPEDMPTEGVLTGKTVQITSLLTNPNTVLSYNDINVVANQIISNFDPSKLKITVVTASSAASGTSFSYAYIDAAGKADPTPATYTVNWPSNGGIVLPVTLTSFNTAANNCLANINWATASEINSSRFDVEVSSNNGSSYIKSSTVSATGSISRGANYNSSYSMQSGVVYLVRLKIIDNDGSFTYSDTRKVSCESGFSNIVLAPNPVSTSFMLRGMDAGKNQISIYSSNGQLMKTQVIVNTQGSIDVSSFASGTYNVRISNQLGTVTTIKMFKN